MAAPANFSALLAAPGATDYGFDPHIARPDDDSTPIASPVSPTAPADNDSTPVAPPTTPADNDSAPIESPVPPLSDDELQAKMKRWGPMLSGDSMTTPADLVEMQSSGKFTPGQLQRAQTESSLRQTYIQQQARTLGQKVGAGLSSGWDTVKNIAQDVTPGLRDYQTYQELAANPQADITENRGRVANSLLEGGYGAAAGVGSLAKGLLTGPLSYLKNAIAGPRTAAQSEQDYQDWKKDYIATHTVPGYAPPAPSAVQNAESYYTGVAPENLPAPTAPLVSLASTAASIPAFGAAAGLGEAAIPKILAATGAEAVAPNLSKLLIPTTAAAKLKGAMSDALAEGAGEAATPALDTAATKGLPTTPATPEQAAAIQAANPSLLDRVNAAGKPISDKVDSAIAGIKALPGNLAEATAGAVSKAGEVAQAPAGVLDKLFAKLPSGDTPVSSYIRYKFLDHIPFLGQAVQAVKALEGAGKLTAGLGDFMERMATANPLDPMGRFAAAAEAAPAGHWMKAVVNNPALKMALKVGTLAGDTAAATAKGAAAGAALGVASNQSPEEIGQAAGGLAAFSGAHGAMSAGQARILDAQIGGVAKVVTDHIAGGGSPDTLKLVPASDILTAANLKSALPDYTVRFATDSDGTKPPVAQGQAGYYDRANKTLWIDPENRAPGSTILHEAFHPIFDQLVAEQPNIKAALDQALARNGDSIDRFKLEYANRVAKGDPGQASDYIAGQDKANPDWAYSEMLSEAASHALDGKDLLQAMQGNDVQQSATQTALQGVEGWLSDNGVDLQQRQNTGTIFPDFKDSFNDPDLRRLTYRLLKAQRDSLFSRTPEEAPGTPLTSAAMGGAVAPTYNENGRQINQYGEAKDTPTGKKFVPFPASEIRRRMNAEKVALPKYFPEVGKNYTTMPAGLLADPDISPWTKNTLKTMFDAKDAQNKVSFWNQGLSGKKSAVSDVAWARQVARDLGNVEARYQSGRFTGVKRSKANNLVMELDSEEAENQRLADWSQQHGPVSLDLWGGDQAAAKADIATYKKNLAANLPGETGLSVDKRNALNALLAGDNKEFQASNPLRSMLKKKDRAATFRSFRPERVGAITAEPTDVPAVKWERAKPNLSPAAKPVAEPAKREIMLTGPDGKQYPAKYDGLQEDYRGGLPLIQVTPLVDLPGATGAKSTTYEPSLLKKGYTLPSDLKAEVDKYNAANPPQPMKFSPSDDPHAIASAAVQDEDTGKIYVGANHGDAARKAPTGRASNLIDGYVTNSGKFLDRDAAFKQAVALKQYKPGPEDRNINQELYGLTSERFNKQNPNTAVNIARAEKGLGVEGSAAKAEKAGTPDYATMDAAWAAKQAKKAKGNFSPSADPEIRDQAAEYSKEQGLTAKPHTDFARLNKDLSKRVADAYEAAPHIPDDPKVQASYKALADETRKQWDFLTNKGVTFEPWTKEGQPYANSAVMRADVQQNKHLYFFPTASGFGANNTEGAKAWEVKSKSPIGEIEDTSPTFYTEKEAKKWAANNRANWKDVSVESRQLKSNNPMLAPTGDPKAPVVNDMFRAVHDYFGHAKEGYDFGPRGEYNAYLAHSKMFSKAAIPALTAETMGQNSWVNFGKHLRDEAGNIPKKGEAGYKSPTERPYAAQKATALPDELTQESLNPKVQFSPAEKVDQTKTPEFKEWFGDWQDPKAWSSKRDPAKPSVSMVVKGRKPLVVYHGTSADFSQFDPTKKGVTNFGWLGQFETQRHGFFATPNPEFANEIIEGKEDKGKNVMPLYMSIKSPVDLTKGTDDIADELKEHGVSPSWVRNVRDQWELFDGESGKVFTDALKKAGYDGAILEESDKHGKPQTTYVAFDPSQIKSASGNSGQFDASNPDIRFSPAQPETISRAAVRVDKEHTFESDSHSGAYAKARKAGVMTEDDQGGPRTEEGFKTSAGRFVDRAEGYRLASAANQVNTREPALTDNGRWLDSSNVKAFSPAAKEQEKLSYPMEMTPGHNTGVLPGLLKAPYDVRERYQADMLKAMEPLFAAFGAKPGATTKSSYKNSAGETEHNPMTAVEVPAQDAKLFGLLHGHFARQESVAGGFQETSPGKWEPVGPHSFDVQATPDSPFADKIKEMGPEAEDVLNKLQPVVGPAVEAVNKKYSGLHSHQLSPSQDPRAVKSAAVKDEKTGKVYTGSYHGEAFEKYFKKNPGQAFPDSDEEEDNGGIYGAPAHLTEGFVTNKGEFLDRQEALERAMEMKQYKDASPDRNYGLESVSFEHQKKMEAKPDQFSPSEEPSEPAPFVPTGVLKHHGNNPAKAAAAVADAKPGQPIALGTFSPPQMSDKAFEKLAGKKMLFVIGDQSNAGPMYKTEGGKEAVRMQGGPGYPTMPDTQGKAGWAFASKHLATRLAKAFKNVDYMAVFVGSPDMIAGAPSFSKAYLAELHEALASGQLKPGVLNRMARDAVRYAKTRSDGGNSIPTVHNFRELEQLLSQPSDRWNEDPLKRGLSFESRSIIIQQLGGVQSSKKFGTPAYRLVRDKYNETGAFEQGQLAQIIKLHPDKPIGTAEEHDVPNYPDYPYVIPGTGLGQPSKKLMMADVLKPWTHVPKIAAQGGNLDYKVRMNMPQTEINPAVFEKK